MRYLLSLLIIFIFQFPVSGNPPLKGILFGTIKDNRSQKSLVGASVHIPDLKLWAITDTNGYYSISNLPNGNFAVEVSCVGYRAVVGYPNITGATRADFLLEPSVIEIENVTVTGVVSTMPIRRSPLQVSIVSKKELNRSSGTTLLEALTKEPGFSIVTTGPAIAKPFIRGLGYNRVVAVHDGVRQEGQQWGDEHGLEVDEYSAQKVEILKGPASLMFGSDAMGGVLHISTHVPVAFNTIQAKLSGSNYSNNRMVGSYANIAGNVNGLIWSAYNSVKNAGDYKNKWDGRVLNSRFQENNFGATIGINKSWGYSHLLFSKVYQNIGMVEGERNEKGDFVKEGYEITPALFKSKRPLAPYQQISHTKLTLDNSLSLQNGARVSAIVGYQINHRKEFENEVQLPVPSIYFDLKTTSYHVAYHHPVTKFWKTSLGFSGMNQQNRNRGEEAIVPTYNLFDLGLYGYTAKTFKGLTVSGGLRYDLRKMNTKPQKTNLSEIKFDPFTKQFTNFSSSLGFSQEVGKIILLKLNLSKGFRAPNVSEMAANGEHEGTKRYEIGNRNLRSENSFSIDGGISIETVHVSANLSPFYNTIKNYIFYQKLPGAAGTDSIIDGAAVFKFMQQNARLRGLDINVDLHPHPLDWLHFENTFSFTQGRFLKAVDGSFNLPLIAPARWLTQLRAEFLKVSKTFQNLYISMEMDNMAAQNNFFSGYATETATKGYTLFHASGGVEWVRDKRKIAIIHLAMTNITDVAYQSHLSRLKYLDENPVTGRKGVFNMGRNFVARIILPLEWRLN